MRRWLRKDYSIQMKEKEDRREKTTVFTG